ncbi:GNAT family N-acetyltransferase [Leptolyngbya sp. NK1-12]
MLMIIRPYQPSDAEAIVAVFRDAVIGTGSSAYNPQQVAIWASYPEQIEAFRQQLSRGLTLVAVVEHQVVAFGQLEASGHVAFLYTSSQFARQGCASAIYQQLEAAAIQQGNSRLYTEASRISKHFFLKMGFQILETEWVIRKGVQFERFKMEKLLSLTSPEVE